MKSLFSNFKYVDSKSIELAWSWQLILSMLVVWALIAFFFYKIDDIEKIALCIRYSIWTIAGLLLICLVRFSFLESGKDALHTFFHPKFSLLDAFHALPIYIPTVFGASWGIITSLASYNTFKTNIMSYSWIICVGQSLVMFLFGLTSYMVDSHLEMQSGGKYSIYIERQWAMYLSSATAMTNMAWANMWCILFFTLLALCAVLMMTIHLLGVFTAIFDDFEFLRTRKREVMFGLIGFLALSSLYFCSNGGFFYMTAITLDSIFTQTTLNLLLIVVALWIYGRERFQRDIQFMLAQPFATWRVYMLRFVAPISMIVTIIGCLYSAYLEHLYSSNVIYAIAILLIAIPWLFIPGYATFRMCQTNGSFWKRFKRCCHPIDWYPVEAENRQRYEEAVGSMDITHQLNEVGNEII